MSKIIIILIISAFALTGCGMTNDEVIAEAKKCEEAGYNVIQSNNSFGYGTYKVICDVETNNNY